MAFVSKSLNGFITPFLAGMCMAAVASAADIGLMVALLAAAVGTGFLGSPAGRRFMMRFARAAA